MVIASLILVACVLCAILGRMGGATGYNTKFRDLGIPTVVCVVLILLGCHSWWLLLAFALLFASLTTYWDFLFGYDNYWFHGFMIGLSLAPVAYATGNWVFLPLAIALTTFWMGFFSKIIRVAVLEELVRYSIVPVAAFLLTIGV